VKRCNFRVSCFPR